MLYFNQLEEGGFFIDDNKALVGLDKQSAYPLTTRRVPFYLGEYMYKICSKCKKNLPKDKFYIDYRRNQLFYCCRKCFSLMNKLRYNLPEVQKRIKKYRIEHRERLTELNRQWRERNPWITHYRLAQQRCIKPNFDNYKYYGGRGIKFKMTKQDFEFLWKRDKAYLLKMPSIDRIDVNGNYILSNCRFIEQGLNTKRRFI